MRVCKYPSCSHTQKHNNGCKMHKFPISREMCLLWLGACGFSTTPSKIPNQYYLCSCHFNEGEGPSKLCPIPERLATLDIESDSEDEIDTEVNDFPLCSACSTPIKASQGSQKDNVLEVPIERPSMSTKSSQTPQKSSTFDCDDSDDPVKRKRKRVRIYDHFDDNIFCDISLESSIGPNHGPEISERSQSFGSEPCWNSEAQQLSPVTSPFSSNLSELAEPLLTEEDTFLAEIRDSAAILEVNTTNVPDTNEQTTEEDTFLAEIRDSAAILEVNTTNVPDTNEQTTEEGGNHKQSVTHQRRRRTLFQPDGANEIIQGEKQYRSVGIQCSRPMLSYEWCRTSMSDEDFLYFTSLKKEAFEVLYEFLGGDEVCGRLKYAFAPNTPNKVRESDHTPRDYLLMSLIRLRRGIPLKDLGILVHLSKPRLSTIFYTWIRLMSKEFKTLERANFVSSTLQNSNPPDCYKPFPNLRCVIDCVEFKLQKPENFEQQSNTHSSYKSACTAKVLVATSVYGGLSFISAAAEGSISDKKLVLKSGLLDHVKPGEAIMCDKGFDIEEELNDLGIDLLIPAYSGERDKFTARELLINKAISTSRIHVERFIKMMRDYRLIRWQLSNSLLDITSDIFRVCAYLVMFHDPFIKWHHIAEEVETELK